MLFAYDVREDDIFQAIHKHYGIGGSYPNGDIVYDIKAPSGLTSCACLNDPVATSGCMAKTNRESVAGSAGDSYKYATHTGKLRGAYAGNEFLTTDGSVDEDGHKSYITGFCDDALKLRNTGFTCGSDDKNNACSNGTQRTASDRGFPKYYWRGNIYNNWQALGYNKTDIDSYTPWYHKITMDWQVHDDHKTQGTNSLYDYGGDVYFRVISHTGTAKHAIVPRGHHGRISTTTGANPQKSAQQAIDADFNQFSLFLDAGASNAATACKSLSNATYNKKTDIIYRTAASCNDSASDECNCVATSNGQSCDSGSAYCSDTQPYKIFYTGSGTENPQKASCRSSDCGPCSCTAECSATSNIQDKTDSQYSCQHLNCCNNYKPGSKTYMVRYHTGTSFVNKQSSGKAEVGASSRTLECGDHLYVYRQIKGVPFERSFVASAGQNGIVKLGSYPKLDEELILKPGRGGVVSGNTNANGKPSIVKKKDSDQVIVNAPGGLKGASDKLNDTWVGPCMLFSLRESFNPEAPGCMSRPDVMRQPTYNALLMANQKFLKSIKKNNGNNKYFPGLGGDGAYSNVFPDRFLLSQAIRDQVRLTTNYIGPNQRQTWGDELTFIGLDSFTTPEFIGTSGFASSYHERLNALSQASINFLDTTNRRKGRVPNFMEASDGNDGAIVIIW